MRIRRFAEKCFVAETDNDDQRGVEEDVGSSGSCETAAGVESDRGEHDEEEASGSKVWWCAFQPLDDIKSHGKGRSTTNRNPFWERESHAIKTRVAARALRATPISITMNECISRRYGGNSSPSFGALLAAGGSSLTRAVMSA